ALRRIDPPAQDIIPVLIDGLQHGHGSVRVHAANILGEVGQDATAAIPALRTALRHNDLSVAQALWKVSRRADEVIDVLIGGLRENPGHYYKEAASGLAHLGAAARTAVPALTEALKYTDVQDHFNYYAGYLESRSAPFEALGHIGPTARSALPALREYLNDRDVLVRIVAAEAIWKIDGQAQAILPVLTVALQDRSGLIRSHAAEALGRMGPGAKDAIPALTRALKDEY